MRISSRTVLITVSCVVLTAVTLVEVRQLASGFFYPPSPPMPTVVNESMDGVLTNLESVLKQKAPAVLGFLQPGLSEGEIGKLEQKAGLTLSADMRALYKWHNGARGWERPVKPGPVTTSMGPVPGCRFLPLDEAIKQRDLLWRSRDGTFVQRLALSLFAGHRKSWITLFDDGAGDGYFLDPKRKESEGAIFFCFAETRSYAYFPSVKNLLAWVTKCYEVDAFKWGNTSGAPDLDEDFTRSLDLQKEFASNLS